MSDMYKWLDIVKQGMQMAAKAGEREASQAAAAHQDDSAARASVYTGNIEQQQHIDLDNDEHADSGKPDLQSGQRVIVDKLYGPGAGHGVFVAYSLDGQSAVCNIDSVDQSIPVEFVSRDPADSRKAEFQSTADDGEMSPLSTGEKNRADIRSVSTKPAESKKESPMEDLEKWMKVIEDGPDVSEGYSIRPPIDRERYTDLSHEGLEGPYSTNSGKVVYYDPRAGKYYDRDTDMYISHDEYQAMTEAKECHCEAYDCTTCFPINEDDSPDVDDTEAAIETDDIDEGFDTVYEVDDAESTDDENDEEMESDMKLNEFGPLLGMAARAAGAAVGSKVADKVMGEGVDQATTTQIAQQLAASGRDFNSKQELINAAGDIMMGEMGMSFKDTHKAITTGGFAKALLTAYMDSASEKFNEADEWEEEPTNSFGAAEEFDDFESGDDLDDIEVAATYDAGEDVSQLIGAIEQIQDMGMSMSDRHYDLNMLVNMRPEMIKRIYDKVKGVEESIHEGVEEAGGEQYLQDSVYVNGANFSPEDWDKIADYRESLIDDDGMEPEEAMEVAVDFLGYDMEEVEDFLQTEFDESKGDYDDEDQEMGTWIEEEDESEIPDWESEDEQEFPGDNRADFAASGTPGYKGDDSNAPTSEYYGDEDGADWDTSEDDIDVPAAPAAAKAASMDISDMLGKIAYMQDMGMSLSDRYYDTEKLMMMKPEMVQRIYASVVGESKKVSTDMFMSAITESKKTKPAINEGADADVVRALKALFE